MKKKVIIIDNSNLSYSGEDINGVKLRGTETSLILLAEQFIRVGIEVHFCNNIFKAKIFNGVKYFNKKEIDKTYLYNIHRPGVLEHNMINAGRWIYPSPLDRLRTTLARADMKSNSAGV